MDTALLIIDIQNDYFSGGAMELVGAEEASFNAKKVLEYFREQNKTIIHIQHLALGKEASFFRQGTIGAEIHPHVTPLANETIVQKYFPNSFRETILYDELKKDNISDLVIIGMMTHMCIDTTTRAAFDLGFTLTILHDACATRDLIFNNEIVPAKSVQGAFMTALTRFAKVTTVDKFLSTVDNTNR